MPLLFIILCFVLAGVIAAGFYVLPYWCAAALLVLVLLLCLAWGVRASNVARYGRNRPL